MMELLATRTRAVVVPYAGGLETEQTLRATLLAERGALGVVDEAALSPETIAREAERMLDRAAPETVALDVSGGKTSAAIISSLVP
jgi:predicted glycosyltransferase